MIKQKISTVKRKIKGTLPNIKREAKRTAIIVATVMALYHQTGRIETIKQLETQLTQKQVEGAQTWAKRLTPKIFYWRADFKLTPERIQAMKFINELAKDLPWEKKISIEKAIQRVIETIKLNEREIREQGMQSLIERLYKEMKNSNWPPTKEQLKRIIAIFKQLQKQPLKVQREIMALANVKSYKQ
ncbi:MAG: hypothetical protein QXI10_00755 [Candidatus Diapherotrites archaeon]